MEKSYLLKYDEWVVPGEVEYAEKKAAQIGAKIQECYKELVRDAKIHSNVFISIIPVYVQITEHIIVEFETTLPYSETWYYYSSYNKMVSDRVMEVISEEEPKIFDLPAEDIRNNLPEWDDTLIPDDSRRDIMELHSIRRIVSDGIEYLDGNYEEIKREFKFSDAKCSRVMETFVKKINIDNKSVVFTEQEEKIADCIKYYFSWRRYNNCQGPWCFPLTMSENDIIDAIHKAYLNAGKRSRRITPEPIDYENINKWHRNIAFGRIANFECLYQGMAGDMIIRFLFDYKNRKIVTAYPIMEGETKISGRDMPDCYDKYLRYCDWDFRKRLE